MAGSKSGSFTTSNFDYWKYYTSILYWEITNQGLNGTTPYSVVSFTWKMKKNSTSGQTWNQTGNSVYTFKIDGAVNESQSIKYDTRNWSVNTEYTLWTKSVTINHGSTGSKTVAVNINLTNWPNTASSSISFDTGGNAVLLDIPMGSTVSLSASSVNLGTANTTITANITRYSTSYYHRLIWKIGSTTVSTVNAGAVASSTYTLTPGEWLTKMTSAASAACSVTLETYTNSSYTTKIGNSSTATFTLNCTAAPTASISAKPSGNSVSKGVSTTVYFDGQSTATITVSGSGVQGSSVKTLAIYQSEILKTTLSANGSWTSGVLTGISGIVFKVIVTDSRGKTAQATVTVTPATYTRPTISNVTAYRCNSAGTASDSGTYLRVRANFAATGSGNSITARTVSTKTSSGSSVQSNVSIANNTLTTIGSGQYAVNTSYVVTFTGTDKMGYSSTYSVNISTSSRIINVKNTGTGIGFGKFAETNDFIETAWNYKATRTSGHSMVSVKRNDTNRDIELAVGSGGVNRGLYIQDGAMDNWLLAYNDSYAWASTPFHFSHSIVTHGQSYRIVLPQRYSYSQLGVASNASADVYWTAWLKRVCADYKYIISNAPATGILFIGTAYPNSIRIFQCYVYDPSKLSNGLPEYSFGYFCGLADDKIYTFGTTAYSFYLYPPKAASADSATTATTATTASKLGSSTVGNTYRPIYLNGGTPAVCNDPASLYNGSWDKKTDITLTNGYSQYWKLVVLANCAGTAGQLCSLSIPTSMLSTSLTQFVVSETGGYCRFAAFRSGNNVIIRSTNGAGYNTDASSIASIKRVYGFI